jgi:LCP family protein required for cell wall assembly
MPAPVPAPTPAPTPAPAPQPRGKRHSRWPITLVTVSLVLLISLSAFLGFTLAIFSRFMLFETLLTLMPGEKLLRETNILVMGLDSAEGVHRSDTMIVVHIDPAKNTATAISIPRDTIVEIPGRNLDKVNHAFAFGGPELSRQTVENFLGIQIPYYISIDMKGLETLIDEVGGVNLDVEKRMYYIDRAQNLFVDLYPGMQKLTGHQALTYLRYRHDGGDINRILRQQKFIRALASQITNKDNLMHSPQLLLKMFSFMDTNLNTRDIIGLALAMRRVYDFGSIKIETVPGTDLMLNGVYYMKPDMETVQRLVSQYLKGS